MNQLKIENLNRELINAIPDPEVGISLAYLAGDDQFASYGIELKPGAFVAPHYHPAGIEIYQILSGKGLMNTGLVGSEKSIAWDQPVEVQGGDFFTIHPHVVHKLENNSTDSLILIATCSPTNLTHNRVVVKEDYL